MAGFSARSVTDTADVGYKRPPGGPFVSHIFAPVNLWALSAILAGRRSRLLWRSAGFCGLGAVGGVGALSGDGADWRGVDGARPRRQVAGALVGRDARHCAPCGPRRT